MLVEESEDEFSAQSFLQPLLVKIVHEHIPQLVDNFFTLPDLNIEVGGNLVRYVHLEEVLTIRLNHKLEEAGCAEQARGGSCSTLVTLTLLLHRGAYLVKLGKHVVDL